VGGMFAKRGNDAKFGLAKSKIYYNFPILKNRIECMILFVFSIKALKHDMVLKFWMIF